MYRNLVNILIVNFTNNDSAGHLIHEMYGEKSASVLTLKCAKEFGE
jgi:hypothetical protein